MLTSTSKKGAPLKLPKIRMQAALLQAAPDLAKLFSEEGPGDKGAGRQRVAGPRSAAAPGAKRRLTSSAGGSSDTPRSEAFFDDEEGEDEKLAAELEEVKRERAALMGSLAALKADQGKAGGELQREDIARLRRELDLKRDKLNQLKQGSHQLETSIRQLSVTSADCRRLMPEGSAEGAARIARLKEEAAGVEVELIEAEAQNRLYELLGERTRREHGELSGRVQEARRAREECGADAAALTDALHETRAAREDAVQLLAHSRSVLAGIKSDWQCKLQDRRKEMREMERIQEAEVVREERRRLAAAEEERAARDRAARARADQDAYEAQVAALQPALEAAEVQWSRLHALTGANTPDQVIAYWQGLGEKEEGMRGLVALAEEREATAQQEATALLAARAECHRTVDPHPGDPERAATAEEQMEEARQAANITRTKFNKLRSVSIAAQQGLRAVQARLEAALSDVRQAQAACGRPARPSRPSMLSSRRSSSLKRLSLTPTSFAKHPSQPSSPQTGGATGSRGAPDAAGSTIDDRGFFPDLQCLLQEVASRIAMLVELDRKLSNGGGGGQQAEAGQGQEGLTEAEVALMKGFRRRTWASTPWLDGVAEHGKAALGRVVLKRKKGNRKQEEQPDFSRLVGYHGSEEDDAKDDRESGKSDDENSWGSLLSEREFIKHRSMKLTARRPDTGSQSSPLKTSAKPGMSELTNTAAQH